MMRRKDRQEKFYSVTYEELIPEEHFLRKLDSLIDFNFIYEKATPLYSNIGRRSADPIMLINTKP